MWVWMCPNHIKAVLKTFFAEAPLFRSISFEITFSVTDKDKVKSNILESLSCTWALVLYLFACVGSLLYFIVRAALLQYTVWELVMTATAIAWGSYICLCIWPPIALLLPRIETDQGWKISWDQALDESKFVIDEKKRVVRRPKEKPNALPRIESGQMDDKVQGGEQNMYTLGDLTNNILDKFTPIYSSRISEDFLSPFDIESGGPSALLQDSSHDDEVKSQSQSGGIVTRISSTIIHLNMFKHSKSLEIDNTTAKAQRRLLSENIGRVALPQKTANMLLGSGLYTSAILPEPSRMSQKDSNRVDTRLVSFGQVYSQVHSRLESMQSENLANVHTDGKSHTRSTAATRSKTSIGEQIHHHPVQGGQSLDLHITSDGRVFRDKEEVGFGALTENVITELNLAHHSEGSSDFLSPFFEEYSSNILGEVGDKGATTHDLHVTRSGRIEPGRHYSLDTTYPELQNKNAREIQKQLSKFSSLRSLPLAPGAQQAKRTGQELLRSMTMSRQASALYEDGLEIHPLGGKDIQSVVMGERAFEILKSRIASQPGSIMLSTIFMQLSQMQPSALENAGFVLPVVPESIFDHTIASKPSFEFRVLPSKTVMFFTINITILLGVVAGGILALFFSDTSV